MKYAFKHLFLLLVVFVCIGCANNNDQSQSNNPTDSIVNNDSVEGGENGKVRGYYHFNDYEDFVLFYAQFKEKNMERYLVPPDSNTELIFDYSFLSEGVDKNDFEEKNYDILFPNQTMYLNISNGNVSFFGKCIDIQLYTIDDLIYEVKDNNQFLILDSNENIVYIALIDGFDITSAFDEFCKLVLEEFEKGAY